MDESAIKGVKSLELNNSESSDAPIRKSRIFPPKNIDTEIFPARSPPKFEERKMTVTGYDTSLSKDVVKSALIKHFSSCGEITDTTVPGDFQTGGLYEISLVFICGKGVVEKAQKLNGGCECDVEGCKTVVDKVMPRDDDPIIEPLNCGGLNLPARFTPKAKMTKG
ncbi:unnamed protein product [Arabis nemorensis]|uniref:RRM domain-containing protein n=1 Tax=Arabis nemorensis TaxID=586526 RepID=A0A565C5C4_9BRAS|nr:unnamed protein product [Arabis nemorensis]